MSLRTGDSFPKCRRSFLSFFIYSALRLICINFYLKFFGKPALGRADGAISAQRRAGRSPAAKSKRNLYTPARAAFPVALVGAGARFASRAISCFPVSKIGAAIAMEE